MEGPATYRIQIQKNGHFTVLCEKERVDDLLEKHAAVIEGVVALSEKHLLPFGEGVRLSYMDRNIECGQCGSHEFCTIEEQIRIKGSPNS